jgi:hypothetical protein
MHRHGHNETLNFSGFSGYYGNMSQHDGYGGFNYSADFLYMNQSCWTGLNGLGYRNDWCDRGYQNVAAASKSHSVAWIYEYGFMESVKPSQTFDVKSLIAASAWGSDASWDINSYTETNGALTLKATDAITVGFSRAETIKFKGKEAKGFSNIAAIGFELVNSGSPGNTCTYGYAVAGMQLVFSDLKIHWNGKIPKGQELRSAPMSPSHGHHLITSPCATSNQHDPAWDHAQARSHSGGAPVHATGGFHSELTSLDAVLGHADPGGGFTSRFALPQVDQFGI